MTVIVWDGNTLAADKLACLSGSCVSTLKIRKANNALIGIAGNLDVGIKLLEWYEAGADPDKYPESQKDKERWAHLMVIEPNGTIKLYEQESSPFVVQEKKYAIGSGAPYAMAAMEMGADAIRAVEVASKFDQYSGNGIDVLRFACLQ